ncbi:RNA helicase [Komagataella phaffii CBS 7435]|uniref:ATP-dependent RNA helicase DRS1 n=2 Tax=Komagataella phaffii TaxID=460519 RepID=C4R5F2_KOMPG|nr:Nucleolar DEAD-box protein required for ribosome assembly and function [Komagataella phaffii GS115]AOA63804.1 GQ67_03833T0 [Komagataella phaffii]CAH2449431.1 RNA helicase [Komagataella phaffii CBS 7435]AOA68524.1 GQ68_03806T0 [Komagataella phaffii GS115]CAY70788.1 Nucleolar DEAD-box protein required for ribosome assembly and function [Komagataella phaffii GS115]CCA39418.1 RNA helicase [Komagataella phaffii CBS 7435]
MAKKNNKTPVSKKAARKPKATKNFTDFVLTISDDEEGIPDLDIDGDEDDEKTIKDTVTENKKAKTKTIAAKANKKKTEAIKDEDGTSLNPDFIFSVEDEDVVEEFNGWDFTGHDSGKVRTLVDLDGIIRRKGGLGVVASTGEKSDLAEAVDENLIDEEEEDLPIENEDEGIDDEELALDGFGMGANQEEDVVVEEEVEDDPTLAEPEPEITEQVEPEDIQEPEDTVEEVNRYFDQTKNQEVNKSVHVTFQSLSLSRPVLKGLSTLGYTKPSPIQSASIPIGLLGKDIVAGAQTGSGKTAAYMIPIIERLLFKPSKISATRVVVLTPTRELAIQVNDVGKKISQFVNGIEFGLAVGGLNLRKQEQELRKRPDIVIATPGRFIDHIRNSPSFSVESVEILVIDEADRMLEDGFQEELKEILTLLPGKKQTMLFSATMNNSIKDLIQLSLHKPVRIMIDPPKQAVSGLVQEFVRLRKNLEMKPALLFDILTKVNPSQQHRIVVFIARKMDAHKLRIILGLLGLKVSELHGSLTQEQRLKSITDFKNLTVPILICTDLASRGLDIPKIEVVINYDMPKTYDIYLHRVGRTARAGREGRSITFVSESNQDRAIVREAMKGIATAKNRALGRNVDWDSIEKIHQLIEEKAETIGDILSEEKEEKQFLRAEMEVRKGENILHHGEEIMSRPKRTWFQSEADKKKEKQKSEQQINSKKRKRLEAKKEAGGESMYKKTRDDRTSNQKKNSTRQPSKNQMKKKLGKVKSKR